MHAYKVHTYEVHGYKMHAYEVHIYEAHARKMHAYEGFYEDLARQNIVARLFQLQLGFRRRHTWVSVSSHMVQSSSWCPKATI